MFCALKKTMAIEFESIQLLALVDTDMEEESMDMEEEAVEEGEDMEVELMSMLFISMMAGLCVSICY